MGTSKQVEEESLRVLGETGGLKGKSPSFLHVTSRRNMKKTRTLQ